MRATPLLDILSKACVNQIASSPVASLQDLGDPSATRVPLGGSSHKSESPARPGLDVKLTQDDLLKRDFTKDTLGLRLLSNSTLDERATLLSSLESGWYVFDTLAELNRQGIPDAHWRVTDVNVRYDLCDTYPALTVVPASVDDGTLKIASAFR
jgi:hypothetical protein